MLLGGGKFPQTPIRSRVLNMVVVALKQATNWSRDIVVQAMRLQKPWLEPGHDNTNLSSFTSPCFG